VDARDARAVLDRFGRFIDRFTDCFSRRVQRTAASQYIEGLFNDSERKSMQAMHGRLSDPIHYQALQHFVTHSPWSDKPLWDRVSEVIPERRGILALDDTGLPKQGRHSVGVKRQYSGTLGKTGNCQVAVSSLLIGPDLVWPLGCELYLPQDWFDDAHREEAGIPSRLHFREKWRIALAQVRAALKRGFQLTAVVTDADYGSTTAFRQGLERLGLRYAVAIRSNLAVCPAGARRTRPVAAVAKQIPARQWRRICWGQGTKGPLAARFVALRVRPTRSRGERWLLCERSLIKDERKYYVLNLDASASLTELVTLARGRWPIEQQSRTQRRTRLGPLRRAHVSWLEPSHRPHRHRLCLSPARTSAGARRSATDVAACASLGPRDHGGALYRQQPQPVESNRRLPAESAAEKMTK